MAGPRRAAVLATIVALWCGGAAAAAAAAPAGMATGPAGMATPSVPAASMTGPSATHRIDSASVATVPTTSAAAEPSAAGAFVPVTPRTVMDTRNGVGGQHAPVLARTSVPLRVLGIAGVPLSGVSAVVLNVTVMTPVAPGSIAVFADGGTQPGISNMSFVKGQTASTMVVAQVGPDGKVRLANNSAGWVQIVVDISGYYRSGAPTAAGTFAPVAPRTVMDTRIGVGGQHAPVLAGSGVVATLTGVAGIPAGASAVLLRVTVVTATAPGTLGVYSDHLGDLDLVSLRVIAGQSTSALMVVALDADGKATLINRTAGWLQLVVDVYGYFRGGAASVNQSWPVTPGVAGGFGGVIPRTILDTRSGVGGPHAPVAAGAGVSARVAGVGGVPASGVSAAMVTVTVLAPAAAGSVTVFADGASQPPVSNVVFAKGQTVSNLAIPMVGSTGKIRVVNNSPGAIQVVVDLAGYYRSVTVGPPTITSIHGAMGLTTGGGHLSLAGTNLVDVTAVRFGGVPASHVDVYVPPSGLTVLDVVAPAHAAGPVDVTVVAAGGTSVLSNADRYTYVTPFQWSRQSVGPAGGPAASVNAVSCASSTFCLAVDTAGRAWDFDGTAWHSTQVNTAGKSLVSVSCPSARFCVAVGAPDVAYTFDGSAWSGPTVISPDGLPTLVSCASPSFCMVGARTTSNQHGEAIVFDGTGWGEAVLVDPYRPLTALTCVTAFCYAADLSGWTFTYSGGHWQGPVRAGQAHYLPAPDSISCLSASFCLTLDSEGLLFEFLGVSWQWLGAIDAGLSAYLTVSGGVSCVTTDLCVAVNVEGDQYLVQGSNLVGPVTTGGEDQASLSCPTATFCAMVAYSGGTPGIYLGRR